MIMQVHFHDKYAYSPLGRVHYEKLMLANSIWIQNKTYHIILKMCSKLKMLQYWVWDYNPYTVCYHPFLVVHSLKGYLSLTVSFQEFWEELSFFVGYTCKYFQLHNGWNTSSSIETIHTHWWYARPSNGGLAMSLHILDR